MGNFWSWDKSARWWEKKRVLFCEFYSHLHLRRSCVDITLWSVGKQRQVCVWYSRNFSLLASCVHINRSFCRILYCYLFVVHEELLGDLDEEVEKNFWHVVLNLLCKIVRIKYNDLGICSRGLFYSNRFFGIMEIIIIIKFNQVVP